MYANQLPSVCWAYLNQGRVLAANPSHLLPFALEILRFTHVKRVQYMQKNTVSAHSLRMVRIWYDAGEMNVGEGFAAGKPGHFPCSRTPRGHLATH